MKVFIKDEKCIGCGSCVSVTDEKIFDFNDEGKAYAKVEEVNEEDIEIVKTAMEYCPTDAILEKTDNEDNNPEKTVEVDNKVEEIVDKNTDTEVTNK